MPICAVKLKSNAATARSELNDDPDEPHGSEPFERLAACAPGLRQRQADPEEPAQEHDAEHVAVRRLHGVVRTIGEETKPAVGYVVAGVSMLTTPGEQTCRLLADIPEPG